MIILSTNKLRFQNYSNVYYNTVVLIYDYPQTNNNERPHYGSFKVLMYDVQFHTIQETKPSSQSVHQQRCGLVFDTGCEIRLHRPLNVAAQQLHLERIQVGSLLLLLYKPQVARIVERQRCQKHATDFVGRAVGRNVAKVNDPMAGFQVVLRGAATLLNINVLLHGLNHRVAVGVNVKHGPLLFDLQQRN